jgi:hypothetical protein
VSCSEFDQKACFTFAFAFSPRSAQITMTLSRPSAAWGSVMSRDLLRLRFILFCDKDVYFGLFYILAYDGESFDLERLLSIFLVLQSVAAGS